MYHVKQRKNVLGFLWKLNPKYWNSRRLLLACMAA
jgi:hypothetical protein